MSTSGAMSSSLCAVCGSGMFGFSGPSWTVLEKRINKKIYLPFLSQYGRVDDDQGQQQENDRSNHFELRKVSLVQNVAVKYKWSKK